MEVYDGVLSDGGYAHLRRTDIPPTNRLDILIADSWDSDKYNDRRPADGGSYLGSGYNKFGVKVICLLVSLFHVLNAYTQAVFEGKDMAIFQCLPKNAARMTEDDNYAHLTAELTALTLGDDLMTKFNLLASNSPTVQLPSE